MRRKVKFREKKIGAFYRDIILHRVVGFFFFDPIIIGSKKKKPSTWRLFFRPYYIGSYNANIGFDRI